MLFRIAVGTGEYHKAGSPCTKRIVVRPAHHHELLNAQPSRICRACFPNGFQPLGREVLKPGRHLINEVM